ncbi:MAG TPA: ATP-binding protein [Aromatoleum sp.]|uniref:ATP-binding protein n=1 Tax=Aromatoleum sp. TaxID=2307007 RepID=UPI002B47755E|nr:ATP-binding protein [Aromatoleum sp.]HJV27180.1 ATP-binding protein [Aromatoleum sp.]
MSRYSIRRRLGLQALFIGAVMLCLALAFVWSQRETDRALEHIFRDEMAPAADLREMESQLQSIHVRMQSVLLTQASPLGALELLRKQRVVLEDAWVRFRNDHRNWLRDPGEDELIADIEDALPALRRFLDATETAYRIYDPVQLTQLVDSDWYQLEQALLFNLRSLQEFQERHARAAITGLDRSILKTRVVVGSLLIGGLLFLGVFSIRLGRYIMQRIVDVEETLEAIASGNQTVTVPYSEGETEMARIATAINRTVAQMADDRAAIDRLSHRQQAILESAAEGIYGVDVRGEIIFMNPAALAMLGYEEIDILGRPSHNLLHHHHADGSPYPIADCAIARARRQGRIIHRDDEVFFRRNGESFPVEYTAAPLVDSDQSVGAVVVFRDVTKRREQESLLRETIAQLRETNARLADTQTQLVQAEKLVGLGALAAGVAHEINNPIGFVSSNFAVLANYTEDLLKLVARYEALLEDSADMQTQSVVQRLHDEADIDFVRGDAQALIEETRDGLQRVIRIVADLREFSRVDSLDDWNEVDIHHAIDTTLRVLAPTLQGKATIMRDEAPLPRVRGNAAQLNQVLMNLLLNATHAIGDKGTITIRTSHAEDEVCIEVQDDGCGMAPDVRARMFDPFYTTRPVGQGTGLGLSVAYSVARAHGGRFEVDSAPGQGTAIRLWLPLTNEPHAVRPRGETIQ